MDKECLLCGSSRMELLQDYVRDSEDEKVYNCKNCGLIQLYPITEDLQNFYDEDKQALWLDENLSIEQKRHKALNDIIRREKYLEKQIGITNKTLLDVGCGYGFFVEKLIEDGYIIDGLEISKDRRRTAEKLCSKKILNIDLLKKENIASIKNYDIVTLFHVLEHIKEPELFLNTLYDIVNGTGRVVIEVPNYDDWLLEVSDEFKKFYFQKAHVAYYNYKSLIKLIDKTNFKIEKFDFVQRYHILNNMHWLINEKPQIKNTCFSGMFDGHLKEINNIFIKYLNDYRQTDTIVLVLKK